MNRKLPRRALEFTEVEVLQALASVRVVYGLYYTTHAMPGDPEGFGERHIDLVLRLLEAETARRDGKVVALHPRDQFSSVELVQARGLLIAVRGAYYGAYRGTAAHADDRHVDLILDLVLDEMDRRGERS